jgi:hypothetical protein
MDDQLVPFVRDALKIFIFINAALIILGFVFGLDITSLWQVWDWEVWPSPLLRRKA